MNTNVELANKLEKDLNQLMKMGCKALGNKVEQDGFAMFANSDPLAGQFLGQTILLMGDLINMTKKQAETLDCLEKKMGDLEHSFGELIRNLSKQAFMAKAPTGSK